MWSHHLLVALRALRRDAGYALLNGVGLTVALACCVLIGLYARSELSFDRFHRDADRAVVVGTESLFGQDVSTSTSTPFPLHLAMATDAPAVDATAMASMGGADTPVLRPGEPVAEARVLFATPGFFEILTFPALAGDPAQALARPEGAVVTASAARRLFGTADALGQRFTTEAWRDTQAVVVAAVVADPPRTSSIDFEVVLSPLALPEDQRATDSWGMWQWMTLGRLAAGASTADLDRQLAEISETHHGGPGIDDVPRYFATALPDFHLSELSRGGGFVGDPRYLALFSAAAGLVLLLGLINYVNLATARAARRAREIGVRKALGAGRGAVAVQFLVESVVLTVLAAVAALALAAALVPTFNAGFETDLALADLDLPFVAAGLAFAVLVGLTAGAYPAAVLSRFDPAVVLRGGSSRSGRPSKNALRRSLVAVQFAVAIALVAGTAVVLQQIAFTSSTDLGVEPAGVVAVPLKPERGPGVSWQAALDAVRQSPGVVSATAATGLPAEMWTRYTAPLPSASDEETNSMDDFIAVAPVSAEPGYLDVLGIDLVAGREPRQPDEVTVNEAFVRQMGWDSAADAIGQETSVHQEQTIVGVMGDYHIGSMRDEIEAVSLSEHVPFDDGVHDAGAKEYDHVVARLAPGEVAAGLDGLRRAWAGLGTAQPFEPEFLDDKLAEMYDADRRLAGVLGGFAVVALLVACLGLVGLAAYTAQRRTKEIGVRRALGATVGQVVALLSREYAALVVVGAVVAVPLAVVLLGRWLDGFAYHVDLGPGLFVAAVGLTLALALAVVGVQAARAARVPPTRALRAD